MKISLIDYGAGNLPSVERALRRLGAETERITAAEPLRQAAAIVLPGVGHYAAVVRALDEHGLRAPLVERISADVPFLGICLGLQALYETSDEAPGLAGLGILPGKVSELVSAEGYWHLFEVRSKQMMPVAGAKAIAVNRRFHDSMEALKATVKPQFNDAYFTPPAASQSAKPEVK